MSAEPQNGPSGDAAERALADLVRELDRCVGELEQARTRAEKLLEHRRSGGPWLEIVTTESRPLIVERISTVLSSLATAGHSWRREQAAALQAEQISINRIAALFGVTRQRISALLKEQDAASAPTGD
ncbi:hypothetical protein E4P40_04235 [Blastococcus sp. CT_GayMR20]|uniref:hypothetical protein n=1 Tax=Blastococcus sp. CT_GayMR20 TaxID=2559609 RepID=UPI001074205D|nr:hypothetical protein [Blastococcus sp. CT_GayMR20]TFV91955.1 hypothetical protein E4P40_04160 [Blastococcus sp. CT_GayMR20]TFV91968.1 hypothetical protein E4P40_04235 [Blastococcus sp. CT_GayMR20]